MKLVTKWRRVCSPSVTMSMPALSWSATARRRASRLPRSSSSPCSSQGAQSFFGSASQAGFGRLPAMVVCSGACIGLARGADVPGGEAAPDVDLGHVAILDQVEAARARRAMRGDPVADFRGAVADGRQALVQEIDQPAFVARFEMADALAVEGLVDL